MSTQVGVLELLEVSVKVTDLALRVERYDLEKSVFEYGVRVLDDMCDAIGKLRKELWGLKVDQGREMEAYGRVKSQLGEADELWRLKEARWEGTRKQWRKVIEMEMSGEGAD